MADTGSSTTPTVRAALFKRVLVIVYGVQGSNGKSSTKEIKFNNINQDAALDDLYAVGQLIANMTAYQVSGVETTDTSKLVKD